VYIHDNKKQLEVVPIKVPNARVFDESQIGGLWVVEVDSSPHKIYNFHLFFHPYPALWPK
jgi:hypothetical protein